MSDPPKPVILSEAQPSRRTCISSVGGWVPHISPLRYGFLLLVAHLTAFAQTTPTLATRLTAVLQRDANGHSPTSEELVAAESLDTTPTTPEVQQALPILLLALQSSDTPVRTYALSTLLALQSTPAPAPDVPPARPTTERNSIGTIAPPTLPAAYKPDIANLLTPAIPQIAAHLTEDAQDNRLLTANILAGFIPDPPAAVYPPLLAFLRRDNAIGTTGAAVVNALLQLGPLAPATVEALTRYLRRSDQNSDSRANLADLIASSRNQSPALNQALAGYINSDDNSLRARVILSLPTLDLTPAAFTDLHARIAQLAENPNENLQVVTAAKSIAPCWTVPHQSTPCPIYAPQ